MFSVSLLELQFQVSVVCTETRTFETRVLKCTSSMSSTSIWFQFQFQCSIVCTRTLKHEIAVFKRGTTYREVGRLTRFVSVTRCAVVQECTDARWKTDERWMKDGRSTSHYEIAMFKTSLRNCIVQRFTRWTLYGFAYEFALCKCARDARGASVHAIRLTLSYTKLHTKLHCSKLAYEFAMCSCAILNRKYRNR